MLVRGFFSLIVTVVMCLLVVAQKNAADQAKFLTVEQVTAQGIKGLSFDRHYAMPIDFCIIAPLTGLAIFLCGTQWDIKLGGIFGLVVVGAVVALCIFWWSLPTKEAHNQSAAAAVFNGIFFFMALWVMLMVLFGTERPQPVLLLMLCVIVPAFLFVGQHMFLGIINAHGAASTYPDQPLRNVVGWSILLVCTAVVWWRSLTLIPAEFWNSLG